MLYAKKDRNTDLLTYAAGFLVVREIEPHALLIGEACVNVDIAIEKMIGDEHPGKADLLIKFQNLAHCCSCATADGIGVQMGFVSIHGITLRFVISIHILSQKRPHVNPKRTGMGTNAYIFRSRSGDL